MCLKANEVKEKIFFQKIELRTKKCENGRDKHENKILEN